MPQPSTFALLLALAAPTFAADDAPVSFSRDVAPSLEERCLACHDEGFAMSDLSMADVDAMRKGGWRGPSLVPARARRA